MSEHLIQSIEEAAKTPKNLGRNGVSGCCRHRGPERLRGHAAHVDQVQGGGLDGVSSTGRHSRPSVARQAIAVASVATDADPGKNLRGGTLAFPVASLLPARPPSPDEESTAPNLSRMPSVQPLIPSPAKHSVTVATAPRAHAGRPTDPRRERSKSHSSFQRTEGR
jgi:hypothetical protein